MTEFANEDLSMHDEGLSSEYTKEDLSTPHKKAVDAIRNAIAIPDEITDIDTAIYHISRSWIKLSELKSAIKAEEKRHKDLLMSLCKQYDIRSIELYDSKKLVYKEVKKTIYDNEAIRKALNFTPTQMAALSTSDIWLKSVVQSIPETCRYVTEIKQMDLSETKPKVKKELVEIDTAFLK